MSNEEPKKSRSGEQPKVKWDDANMRSSYANVCNAVGTREEIVLMFGVNQAWHGGHKEVTVQLTDRIILSPHAAKRMSLLLGNLIRQHEERFGPLDITPRAGEAGPEASLEH